MKIDHLNLCAELLLDDAELAVFRQLNDPERMHSVLEIKLQFGFVSDAAWKSPAILPQIREVTAGSDPVGNTEMHALWVCESHWPDLDVQDLTALAHHTVRDVAERSDLATFCALGRFWIHLDSRMSATERMLLLVDIIDSLYVNDLSPLGLIPVVITDRDRSVAGSACLTLLLSYPRPEGVPFVGVRCLLDLARRLRESDPECAVTILGTMLAAGDEEAIDGMEASLADFDRAIELRLARMWFTVDIASTAHVKFLLRRWKLAAENHDEELYEAYGDAVCRFGESVKRRGIQDMRLVPLAESTNGNGLLVERTWQLAEFSSTIEGKMKYLCCNTGMSSGIVARAMRSWGLSTDRIVIEQFI
ncbi:MAG: hypothetical protein GY835_00565 [bacterium]|nr:hypothetical protein [bacterium]